MELETIIFGDPHCGFDAIDEVAEQVDPSRPPVCIFLGDFGFADRDRSTKVPGQRPEQYPFKERRTADEILRPLADRGCQILHIRGNHDLDDEAQYGAVISSRILRPGHLNLRVVEVGGIRIAGLDGVFGGPWNPDGEEKGVRNSRLADTRRQYIADTPGYWYKDDPQRLRGPKLYTHPLESRPGLQMGHRKYIFPEDIEHLRTLRADVLISHEAPKSPILDEGFNIIGRVAEEMGVKTVIHGHHHRDYASETSAGIEVIGVGRQSHLRLDLARYGTERALSA
ncbi:Calcineurin-like phosphoesterase superfamily domain protein [compost metagenome]